jgi:hypothetical protein
MRPMSDDNYKTFLCEYPFDGSIWCFEIKAASHADAEARMKQMPFAKVCGETLARVDLPPLHRWFPWLFRK